MSLAGVGKPHKPFHINLRKEVAFARESNGTDYDGSNDSCTASISQEAVSGPVGEQPTFTPKNKRGEVKKGSQLGSKHKVQKLAFEGETNYGMKIENFKPFYHVMGGVIDFPRKLKLSATSDDWAADDEVYTSSKVIGRVESYDSDDDKITLYEWTQGEDLQISAGTGNGDSSYAKLLMIRGNEMFFDPASSLPGSTGITTPDSTTVYLGGTSGAKVQVNSIQRIVADHANLSNTDGFEVGEKVTGGTSNAIGVVVHLDASQIVIYVTSGTFQAEEITGGINSYTADISNLEVLSIQIEEVADSDNIDDGGSKTGTVSEIYYSHYIFVYHSFPHYTINYAYEALNDQHLALGAVSNTAKLETVNDDIPNIQQGWVYAKHKFDPTIDSEVTNTITTLQDYTNLSLVLNNNDYSDIYNTVSIEVKRDIKKVFGNSLNAKGMVGPEVEFDLTFGIHRENKSLHNLRVNDTRFDGNVTLLRGTSGEDEAIFYFDNSNGDAQLRALEFPETEKDKKIHLEAPYDVEGTAVLQVYDKEQYYG